MMSMTISIMQSHFAQRSRVRCNLLSQASGIADDNDKNERRKKFIKILCNS